MDHRPFKDWLLNDDSLTPEQDRDLRVHLRTCSECSALERANLSLRSAAALAPAAGFTLRFQTRLIAQRKLQRRRTFIGLFLLALVGIGVSLWYLSPYLPYLALPPDRLASLWINSMVNFALITRALQVLVGALFNVALSLIPADVWMLLTILLCVFAFLLAASFRWVGKAVRSVA